MRLWSAILLVWFGLAFSAGADSTIHLRTTKTENYLASYWTTEQGLPQNTVNCLIQTRDGYLWAGTRCGLVRFDGLRFTTFSHELNLFDPDHVDVRGLAEDAQGRLWLRTMGGLVSYHEGQFKLIPLPETPFPGPVRSICAEHGGGVWTAKRDGIYLVRDGKVAEAIGLDRFAAMIDRKQGEIDRVLEDSQGALWVLLFRYGGAKSWQRMDRRTGTVETLASLFSVPQDDISGLLEASPGQWWLGRPGELIHWENGRLTQLDASSAWGDTEIKQMLVDGRGDIWIVSGGPSQLHRFSGGHFSSYGRPEGITGSDDVRSLLPDREGNLWIGTGGSGLNRLQPRQMVSVLSGSRSTMDEVFSISAGQNGHVWLATTYGLVRFQSNLFQVYTNSWGLGQNVRRVRPVFEDRTGRVWFGLDSGGLYTMQNESMAPVENPFLGGTRLINSFCEDHQGTLWISTRNGLVEKKADKFRLWTTNDGLSDNVLFGLTGGPDGRLWIGSRRGGINEFKDGKFRAWLPRDGLLSAEAWPLRVEPDGSVWVGTPQGLNRIRNGQVRAVTTASGLFDDVVYCLLADRRGNYWTFSNRGIWRMKKAELNAVADGHASRVFCVSYGEAEGMVSTEGNGDDCPNAAALPNGELWFPTTRGVVIVDPDKLRDHDVAPLVVIEEVRADGQTVQKNGQLIDDAKSRAQNADSHSNLKPSIRLAPGRARVLEIHYTANTFIDAEKVRFRFQLEGHDPTWRDADTQRIAIYTNLRPGEYRFRVQACNFHGYWSQTPAEFSFSLEPHFYQTWLFSGCCFVTVLAGALGWHHRRVNFLRRIQLLEQQQVLQEERGRIAKDLHDDLGASLTGIALEAEIARREVEQAGGSPQRLLGLAQSARALVDRMREVIWTVNPLCDTLESFCTYLCGYSEAFLGTAGLRCRLDFPAELPALMLSAETRHELLLIAKEALHNSVKHAVATEVRLALAFDGDWLIMSFEDNGRGFAPSAIPSGQGGGPGGGRGLYNMRRRVAALGGFFDLSTRTGLGTCISLRVPIAKKQ